MEFADWSKRTDFSMEADPYVGYKADDGEIIRGDLIRVTKKNDKIFVHFTQDAGHLSGNKYQWIKIPNDRLCPPPATRPKQVARSFEMTDAKESNEDKEDKDVEIGDL